MTVPNDSVSLPEDHYRLLFEANPLPMWVYATDSLRFLAVNEAAVDKYGWTRDEFLRMAITDIRPPEDVDAVRASVRAMDSRPNETGPWRHRLKDGTLILVQITSRGLMFDGRSARLVLAQDVTAQVRVEQALRDSERRLTAILDAGGMGAWEWEVGRQRSVWNRKEFELLGLPPHDGDVDTNLFFQRVHPDDRASLQAAISTALSDGGDFHSEFRVVIPSDEVRWLAGSGQVYRDPTRQAPVRMFGVNYDISGWKRAEEEVRRHNDGLRLLSESAAALLAATDPKAMVEELFDRVSAYLGCDLFFHYEAVGGGLRLITSAGLDEPTRERLTRLELGQALCGMSAARGETVCRMDIQEMTDEQTAGARELGLRAYACHPLLAGQRLLGTLSFASRTKNRFTDHELEFIRTISHYVATARERMRSEAALTTSERLYRAVVEHSADGLVLATRNERTTFSSPAVTAILGYTSDEFRRLRPDEMHHPDDLDRVWAVMREATANPGRSVQLTHRMRCKDGAWRWIDSTVTDWSDDPTVGAIVINMRDVTDREASRAREKRAEERLRQSAKMEAIGQLAGGVAHDFNNLLTVIGGFTELVLMSTPAEHPHRTPLNTIRDAGERAAALTHQLLAFSRRQAVEPRILDLNTTVAQVEQMLRRLIGEDIVFTTSLATGLPLVQLDPTQVEQVVFNLAVNARDAMPNGGRLTLETAAVRVFPGDPIFPDFVPGMYVRLSVADTGLGMSPEVQAHIFEPFFTTKDVGQGTGLGLATVYGIVRQAGGHVTVETAVGLGTTFRVYFPAAETAEIRAAAARPSLPDVNGTETILLVEDEAAVRGVTTLMLESYGYRVLPAGSGAEALHIAATHPGTIHLTLTDVVMPEMGGRELAAILRGTYPHLRVVFMSGYTDAAVVQGGASDITNTLVLKPFTPHALATKVRATLDA